MTMRQFTICVPRSPGAVSPPMLLASVPQKSAVKTSKLKTKIIVTMNAKMGTSLHTITMALTTEASSTPWFTSRMMNQLTTDMKMTAGTVSSPAKGG